MGMLAINMALPLAVGIGAVALLGLWVAVAFNRLVKHRNLAAEGWSGIDVQLQRRADLVPNLVECVKGYAEHEKLTLQRVTELRGRAGAEKDLASRRADENALTDQLRRLFALAEAYPDLKANRNFLDLQAQLAEIENQVQMARRYYNGAVRNYNIRVESFPSNLVAGLFGYGRMEFFEIETATDRAAPHVEMGI